MFKALVDKYIYLQKSNMKLVMSCFDKDIDPYKDKKVITNLVLLTALGQRIRKNSLYNVL